MGAVPIWSTRKMIKGNMKRKFARIFVNFSYLYVNSETSIVEGVVIVIDEEGIRVHNEITNEDVFVPWSRVNMVVYSYEGESATDQE